MSTLTPRQEQVMHMLAAGYTVRPIAEHLNLAVETIRFHIKGAYAALDVHNRRDALAALETSKTRCLTCGRPLA